MSSNGISYTYASAIALPANQVQADIDIHVQTNTGTGNVVTVYVDGILFTSTSEGSGSAEGIINFAGTHNDMGTAVFYSECMVADEDTRGLRVAMLEPNAAGTVEQWDGAYTDVDERGDGLVISTRMVNQRQFANLSAYGGPASPTAVRGVFVQAWAKEGTTGPQNISSTAYDAADAKTLLWAALPCGSLQTTQVLLRRGTRRPSLPSRRV